MPPKLNLSNCCCFVSLLVCRFVLTCPMNLSGWRAAKSVRLFVDKIYRYHFLSMLGEEPQENQSLQCVGGALRKGEDEEDSGSEDNGECKLYSHNEGTLTILNA